MRVSVESKSVGGAASVEEEVTAWRGRRVFPPEATIGKNRVVRIPKRAHLLVSPPMDRAFSPRPRRRGRNGACTFA
jgi:hypothetical protein